jgi:galacturan 1,4-alpha-galacturonidase
MHLFSSITALLAIASATQTGFGRNPILPRIIGKTCTVKALGNQQDDVPNILHAFSKCNNGGTIIFPEKENYWIASQLHPVLSHVEIEWRGTWKLSDNLTYWRDTNNTIPIHFQNHHAQFTISGDHIHLNGFDTGRLDGNGNVWYNAEEAVTQPVRPMNFVWWNASEVLVEHCESSRILDYW